MICSAIYGLSRDGHILTNVGPTSVGVGQRWPILCDDIDQARAEFVQHRPQLGRSWPNVGAQLDQTRAIMRPKSAKHEQVPSGPKQANSGQRPNLGRCRLGLCRICATSATFRPRSFRRWPSLAVVRRNWTDAVPTWQRLAKICQSSTELAPISAEFGPNSASFGHSAEFRQIWAGFDPKLGRFQIWTDIYQHRADFGRTWPTSLGSGPMSTKASSEAKINRVWPNFGPLSIKLGPLVINFGVRPTSGNGGRRAWKDHRAGRIHRVSSLCRDRLVWGRRH